MLSMRRVEEPEIIGEGSMVQEGRFFCQVTCKEHEYLQMNIYVVDPRNRN